jgi:mannose-1-phosphate guanylyltransferase
VLPALVLTAGLGSRLDPLTRLVAKPAVPVAGRTLVERVLEWLYRENVRDVVLNLHHRPETITSVIGDGTHLGLRARYSWEQPLLGSAGGPRHALPLLDAETFLIVNGDTLCDFPLAQMMAAHDAANADVTMALIPNPAPDRYNSVLLDADRRVRGFVPKGTPAGAATDTRWHFIGVQIARASLFAPLTDGVPAETVSSLYAGGISAKTLNVLGYPVFTSFVDVGTPSDYLKTALHFAGDTDRVIEPGAGVERTAVLAQTVVWPEAHIEPGARLDECIVAGAVRVPANFSATRSVIVPSTVMTATDRATLRDGVAVFPL